MIVSFEEKDYVFVKRTKTLFDKWFQPEFLKMVYTNCQQQDFGRERNYYKDCLYLVDGSKTNRKNKVLN